MDAGFVIELADNAGAIVGQMEYAAGATRKER
jgi:hypothetical protein